MANKGLSKPPQQRMIRVFVSSTFRDMKEEREELVKRVFPRLRKICEQRGVTWGVVDLRWGITDEQKAEGKVLPICLKEIHECRPYFIGLLGERYGWVPIEIPDELIEQEPWLAEHRERSVTELEIIHGVLNNPEMADHAYFYFRDPAYVKSLSEKQKDEYFESATPEEIEELGPEEAERRAEDRRKKLTVLKERIRGSGLPVRENYPDTKQLGELVFKDLAKLIDQLFPEGEEPDPLDKEATEHEAFAQSRFQVYIGRQEYYDCLNEHARGDGPPLVVLGESGSGKSALIANWAADYRERHPDDLLITHYIGATPYSADWAAMLRRIMGELKRRYEIQGDIPTEPDKLKSTFANWLHMASTAAEKKGEKIILILDALNQLEDRDSALDLVWLPPFIPKNFRLILSTLPGRPLDNLLKREWPTMDVQPLVDEERKELITEYLGQYRKTLSDDRVERIASTEQTHNPLFLRSLLEELRVFGVHHHLDRAIEHYISSGSIPELFERVLKRLEQDYEREWPGLVEDAMTFVWASRRGLSEEELLDLLGAGGNPLPGAQWVQFYSAVEKLFVSRSGLISFAHNYIREAIQDKYLRKEEARKTAHEQLAEYFTSQELSPRLIDELPWQLAEAESWQRLYDLLANLDFFTTAWQENEFEVKRYWVKVEDSSSLRKLDAYQPLLEEPDGVSDSDALMNVSTLLEDMGYSSEALSLWQSLADRYRQDGDHENHANCLRGQSKALWKLGDLDGAMVLLKKQEFICREISDSAGLQVSLGNQAVIKRRHGDFDGAMELLKEKERICRELGDPGELGKSLGNQAVILYLSGDLDGAMALHKEEERVFREHNDPAGLGASLGNQALVIKDHGNLDGAMVLRKEEERIYRELGDPEGLQRNLGNQAIILMFQGDLDQAMGLLKEQECTCRKFGFTASLSTSLGNQAVIYWNQGDLEKAMAVCKDVECIFRERGDAESLQTVLGNQALILKDRGDFDGAMALLVEQERICHEVGLPLGMVECLTTKAKVLTKKGQPRESFSVAEKAYKLATDHGYGHKMVELKTVLAEIHIKLGDSGKAVEQLKEQEHTYRTVGDIENLSQYLATYAKALADMGQTKEALPLVEEAYELATKHGFVLRAKEIKPVLDEIRSQLDK